MAVIRGTDFESVREGKITALPIRYIPKRIAERKTLQINDILLETAGGSKDRPTGRSVFIKPSIIHQSDLPFTCASFSRFIRIDPTKADPSYIFWHLQYLYNAGYLLQYHTQHTGVARFQYTVFSENEELYLPPLPTQKKIAGILSAYDDLIENNTKRIKILEEMAQILYHEWFVKFRFPGHEHTKMVDSELGLIPEGWEVKKLDDIVLEIIDYRGKTPKKLGGDWSESGIIAISAKNIKQGKIINLDKSKFVDESLYKKWMKSELKQGDILMTSEAPLGELYYLVENKKFCLSQRVFSIRANPETLMPVILYCALSSSIIQEQIYARQSGTTVLGIRQTELRKVPVIVPSMGLQIPAAQMLENLFKAIETLEAKNSNLRQTRDLLLPKLISGEIDVEQLDITTEDIAA
ncbi:restriction endonuclease subunit S [Calothrix sp. FACHB-1219]|nr:restriction endonuclease subunit S [Calothrix sp. FACHB-168]MBD2222160.1 restriction endonuclease subunit S [Calothrix sp. FACHB-1219]